MSALDPDHTFRLALPRAGKQQLKRAARVAIRASMKHAARGEPADMIDCRFRPCVQAMCADHVCRPCVQAICAVLSI